MTGGEPEENGILETQVGHFKKGIVKSAKCGRQSKRRTKTVFILFVRDRWRRSMRNCDGVGSKTESIAINRRQGIPSLQVCLEKKPVSWVSW